MIRKQWHVGLMEGKREIFPCIGEPTRASHGHLYLASIGPFRTKRGAIYMRDFGQGNPHCQTVADAERLALVYAGQTELIEGAKKENARQIQASRRGA